MDIEAERKQVARILELQKQGLDANGIIRTILLERFQETLDAALKPAAWVTHTGGDAIPPFIRPDTLIAAEARGGFTCIAERADDIDWQYVLRYRVV